MKLHLKSSVSLSRLEDGCRSASPEAAQHGEALRATKLCEQRGACLRRIPTSSTGSAPSYYKLCKAMAHKPEQISLLRAPISRMWSFDARKSCGQIRAAAVSVRSAFPGLLADNIATFRSRREGHGPAAGGSGSTTPPREAPWRCCSGRCFPTADLCDYPDNSE